MPPVKKSVNIGPVSVMALCAAVAIATALLCFFPVQSNEVWLQMAQAREMFEPGPASLSHTVTDTGHISNTWLSDLIFYAVHGIAGPTGLILLRILLIMATLAGCVVLAYGRPSALWGVVALAPFALAFAPLFRVDARLFTWLFAVWQIVLVDRALRFSKGWLLLLLPPMYVLWVNMDEMAAIGWILLVAYGLGMWLQSAMGRHEGWLEEIDMAHVEREHIAKLVPAVLCSGAAILFNPHGVMAFVEPIKWLQTWTQALGEGQVGAGTTFDLLGKEADRFVRVIVFLIVAMIAGVIGLGRMSFGALALMVITSLLGLWRFSQMVLFAMLTVALVGPALGEAFGRHLRRMAPQRNASLGVGVSALLIVAILSACVLCFPRSVNYRFAGGVTAGSMPTAAFDHLRDHRPDGDGFNPLHWGGVMLWSLGDDGVQVFVDGRLTLYRRAFFADRYNRIAFARVQEPTWNQVLDEEGVNWILLDRRDPLTHHLRNALYRQRDASDLTGREWGLVWFDDNAEIFERRSARSDAEWSEIEITLMPDLEWIGEQSDVMLRRNPQWRDQLMALIDESPNSDVASRLLLLYDERVGTTTDRIESLQRRLSGNLGNSERVNALHSLGVALLREGDTDAAIETLQQAIQMRPDDATLWESIAAAHWTARHESETVEAYQRLQELAPSNPVAREALQAHADGTLWDDHPTSQN